jgi:hypothetical protein
MQGTARAISNKAGKTSSFTDLADDDSWRDKYFEGSFLASRDQFFFPHS